MSAIYPYCVNGDVSALNQHRTYDANSKPTLTQVKQFMLEIASQIKAICDVAGYDTDNFHSITSTIADAITAGDDQTVNVASGDGSSFVKGDLIKIEGLTSGVRAWEFTEIEGISTDTLTIDAANSYDASSVTVYVVNDALNSLRSINAIGAAWKAEEAAFMGVSPNQSDHAEKLKELYFGNEENMSGLWAIMNIPGFLVGATTDTEAAVKRSTIDSYGIQNETDSDVKAKFEIDEDW